MRFLVAVLLSSLISVPVMAGVTWEEIAEQRLSSVSYGVLLLQAKVQSGISADELSDDIVYLQEELLHAERSIKSAVSVSLMQLRHVALPNKECNPSGTLMACRILAPGQKVALKKINQRFKIRLKMVEQLDGILAKIKDALAV